MKKEFKQYLTDISISKTIIKKIEEKYNILKIAANVDDFNDIFLSEISDSEGDREYFSLWAFTDSLFCRISIGISGDNENKIVLFKSKNNIARFVINDYNYDLNNAPKNAIIESTIRTFDMEIPYGISASGINCDKLLEVSHKYFIANF